MKLDNEKNIKICQKALYAEQLECYANLCELYAKLAKFQGPKATAEDIQNIYAKPLSLAAKGDLDFDKVGIYEPSETEIFVKYAEYSKQLNDFKTASKLLSEVLINE
jgi:hypothetical protein